MEEEIFRDPLSNLLFHTKLTLPSLQSTYHLCGTGTSGFFSVGFYSNPLDVHESIHRHLNLTHLYGKPLELNEKIDQIQRLLITSQRPIFFLMQLTQDIEYQEFIAFFQVQLLAQHRALSNTPSTLPQQQLHNDQSTTTTSLIPPASPVSRKVQQKHIITQQVHDDLQLLLRSFPQHNYRKGDRILFFQGETTLRIETDCPHQQLSFHHSTAHPPHTVLNQQSLSNNSNSTPFVPVPIPSDNIICQHLRSIFIMNSIYPFDQEIESLYCRTPNHLPQPSLQRLPIVLLISLLSGVSIQQQKQDIERRQSFSTSSRDLRMSSNNSQMFKTALLPSQHHQQQQHQYLVERHPNSSNHYRSSLNDFQGDDETTSSSSSSSSSSSDDDDDDNQFSQKKIATTINDPRLSYEYQRHLHQKAFSGQQPTNPKQSSTSSPSSTTTSKVDRNKNNDNRSDFVTDAIDDSIVDQPPTSPEINQRHANRSQSLVGIDIDDEFQNTPLLQPKQQSSQQLEQPQPLNLQQSSSSSSSQSSSSSSSQISTSIRPLVLPLINPDTIFRSSYAYIEKTSLFGFAKWKRRYLFIRGQFLYCSHHHLMEPTMSLNLQRCKIYVDQEHRIVEYDALPILNSPNSYFHSLLNLQGPANTTNTTNNTKSLQSSSSSISNTPLTPQQQLSSLPPNLNRSLSSESAYHNDNITNNDQSEQQENNLMMSMATPTPQDSSLTQFFSDLIDKHLTTPKQTQISLGSHLTRVPEHLCARNSFHVIFVIIDQSTGYQLRVSMEPSLAKKWLRDFVVTATLSRVQAQLQSEVLESAQHSKRGPSSSWNRHYYKLLPYLAHYRRDSSLLHELQEYQQSQLQQPQQDLNNFLQSTIEPTTTITSIATAPTTTTTTSKPKPIGEVLPDAILAMLYRKQREFITLTMNSHQDPNSINVENLAASYAEIKSQMYDDKPLELKIKKDSKPYQPTIEPQTPLKRQPPAASAKSYFDSLKKPLKPTQQQLIQQPQVPQYLIANSNKVTILEIVIGFLLLLLSLGYYHYFRQ